MSPPYYVFGNLSVLSIYSEVLGSGDKVVTLSYKSWDFGPIYARYGSNGCGVWICFLSKISIWVQRVKNHNTDCRMSLMSPVFKLFCPSIIFLMFFSQLFDSYLLIFSVEKENKLLIGPKQFFFLVCCRIIDRKTSET